MSHRNKASHFQEQYFRRQARSAENDRPVIVTGDFNFEQDSDFYKGLVSGKLRDSKFVAEMATIDSDNIYF